MKLRWPTSNIARSTEKRWKDTSSRTNKSLGWTRLSYVENSSQEILAGVTQYEKDGPWTVHKNGLIYGEYLTKEAAMRKAEEVTED